jgi:hypothetical protein
LVSLPLDLILGYLQPSLTGLLVCLGLPRTEVLGYFLSSLRDWGWLMSCPCGTGLVDELGPAGLGWLMSLALRDWVG